MRRFIDFHTHSTASDGACSPAEVVGLAERARLAAVALTDHDTVAGVASAVEAAEAFGSLRLIAGVEISAIFRGGTMHLLGLGLDVNSPRLAELMVAQQAARAQRDPLMLAKLRDLGVDITMDDVRERGMGISPVSGMGVPPMSGMGVSPMRGTGVSPVSGMGVPPMRLEGFQPSRTLDNRQDSPPSTTATGGTPVPRTTGRMHFAQALMRKGYVQSVAEAFRRYIGFDAPAYVDKERFTAAHVIEVIHAASGLAVLAHPVSLNLENRMQFERVVRELAGQGLDGLEAYHTDHDAATTRMFLDLARRLTLGPTGGSDFHGTAKPHVHLGNPTVPLATLTEKFRKHLGL